MTAKQAEALLEGLDANQRRAVQSTSGPVRIIAGAGAGKTRTITRRIAYACALDVWNPAHALAVTFSAKAAAEMRSRLAALGAGEVRAKTFHSAALSQLRFVWSSLTDEPFPVLRATSLPALSEAVRVVTNQSDLDIHDLRLINSEIDWTKVSLIAPEDYPAVCSATGRIPPAQLDPVTFAKVALEFERQKSALGEMNFNDILLLVCHILQAFPEQARRIRRGIDCVTVDEYQDVSPLQHRLLRLWLGGITEVCVVGDAAQTIYSFAGATSHYLLDFAREFAPVHSDIVLDRDYRSTPQIVHYANRVLDASPCRDDYLTLVSARGDGHPIRPTVYDDELDEARGIASRVSRLVSLGVRPGDIGVLARTNAQLVPIRKALADAGIPLTVRGDRREAQEALSAGDLANARHAAYAEDDAAWDAQAEKDMDDDGSDGAEDQRTGGAETGVSGTAGAGRSGDGATGRDDIAPSADGGAEDDAPTAAAADRRMERERRITELLDTPGAVAEGRADPGTVSLSTIHSSKGLEWRYVFVAGCADGLIPYGRPRSDAEREEERRLMYVAVTRAEDALFPSYPKGQSTAPSVRRPLSPFLRGM